MIENQTTKDKLQRQMRVVLSDEEWQYLLAEGKVKKARDLDELEDDAERLRQAMGKPVFERTENRVHMLGVSSIPARKDAVSRLLAESAADRDDVRQFREAYIRRGLVDFGAIEDWIRRQVIEDGPRSLWLSIVLPPGHEITAKNDRPVLSPGIKIDELENYSTKAEILEYGIRSDDWVHRVPISVTGVLGKLRQLSLHLAWEYGWQPGQASVFVLTGVIPEVEVSEPNFLSNTKLPAASRILLKLDPALSPAQVAKIYREARAKILKTRYRNVSEKHTRLAAFSTLGREGEKLGDRRAAWNKRYPRWKYKDDWNFSRDLNAARKRLVSLPIVSG